MTSPIVARFQRSSEIAQGLTRMSENLKLPTLGRLCQRSKSIPMVKTSHMFAASLAIAR
jgi:hypothetical protein